FTKEAIKADAEANIAPGARVVSDGLGCSGGLADAGLKHKSVGTGAGRPKDERFTWTNTGLGTIKSAIAGTYRAFDPQHAARYRPLDMTCAPVGGRSACNPIPVGCDQRVPRFRAGEPPGVRPCRYGFFAGEEEERSSVPPCKPAYGAGPHP